jgi:hypothetical protein
MYFRAVATIAATVAVVLPGIPPAEPIGGSWEILQSSHRAERVDAHTFRFDVPVPAGGATQLTYTVRVRWC